MPQIGKTMKQARTLDDRRIATCLKSVANETERAMFLLSIKAGLRAAEIAALTWDRIDLEGNTLLLTETKGGKPRSLPINQQLREALLALTPHKGPWTSAQRVIIGPFGRPLSANSVAQWFRTFYVKRMGWEGFSSHSGRRTFVTKAARAIIEAGGTLKDVQSMVGHADMKTTSRYIDTNEDAQKRVVDMI
jgi:integrase/recombinase XerD